MAKNAHPRNNKNSPAITIHMLQQLTRAGLGAFNCTQWILHGASNWMPRWWAFKWYNLTRAGLPARKTLYLCTTLFELDARSQFRDRDPFRSIHHACFSIIFGRTNSRGTHSDVATTRWITRDARWCSIGALHTIEIIDFMYIQGAKDWSNISILWYNMQWQTNKIFFWKPNLSRNMDKPIYFVRKTKFLSHDKN